MVKECDKSRGELQQGLGRMTKRLFTTGKQKVRRGERNIDSQPTNQKLSNLGQVPSSS